LQFACAVVCAVVQSGFRYILCNTRL